MHTTKLIAIVARRQKTPDNLGDILQQIAALSPRTILAFTVIARRILMNLKDQREVS